MRDRFSIERIQAAASAFPGGAGLVRPFAGTVPSSFILIFILFFTLIFASSLWALPAGTAITNTATAGYLDGSSPAIVSSNTSTIITVDLRTPSTLELFQYAPASAAAVPIEVRQTSYSSSATGAGPFVALPAPAAVGGAVIDISSPVPLVPATQYHITEPMFIRVTDLDQNLDPLSVESLLVTVSIGAGETEVVRLTETAPDSGIFSGYLPSGPAPAVPGSGLLNAQAGDTITFSYTDAADSADLRAAAVLIDPFGIVFNSITGQPVNGATITIMNAATGQPAVVFGDDGISIFPATVTSGGTVVDSSNAAYTFPPGGYRFPFVLPGNYQYVIRPPANFRAPSQVQTATLQSLPGGPFVIVPGSRGEPFLVDPGPVLHIDVPLDPTGRRLYIQKTAGRTSAAVGDHVPYRVTVENIDPASPVTNVQLADRLPHGFRYKHGTVRIDNLPAVDPVISADGRTVIFQLGAIASGRTIFVSYIATVGAGARPGAATNVAHATGDLGAVSNTAQAQVEVREDLFREKATIVGQLLVDGCGNAEHAGDTGIEGVRIFLEDGTYTVTDRRGMFHFAEVKPGSHVVQVDIETVPKKYEPLLCSENTRFAGNGYSQFVDIQGGMLWRADFHLGVRPKQLGSVGLVLSSQVRTEPAQTAADSPRNLLDYDAAISVDSVPLRNARLTVMLPAGIDYRAGSSRLNDGALAEPDVIENTLTYRFDEFVSGQTGTIRFTATVDPPAGVDSFTARALLTADTPDARNVRTPVAENTRELVVVSEKRAIPEIVLRPQFASGTSELTRKDIATLSGIIKKLKKLDIKHIIITGHTDSVPIRSNAVWFKDNYELSKARAKTVAEFIRKGLHLQKHQVETVPRGPDEPVATNETDAGRSLNRRVELTVYSIRVVTWAEVKGHSATGDRKTAETVGLRPDEIWQRERTSAQQHKQISIEEYSAEWIETVQPGFELLSPAQGHYPEMPSIKIAVKHRPGDRIVLALNGQEVDAVYFDGSLKRNDAAVEVSFWRGVHLVDGDNIIQVSARDSSGAPVEEITRTLHYSTQPVRALLVPERSLLVADGRTPPVIAVKLLDKEGHPARAGIIGEYSIDPPHLPRQTEQDLRNRPLSASTSERRQYQVTGNGIALIELQPTNRSGDAVIRLNLIGGVQEIRSWLKSEDRDWILVGLAEGTAGYNTVSGNLESLAEADAEEGLHDDNRIAFYAKGRIKGEWLMTMAYDSDKRWKKDERKLYEIIDPHEYYTIYGDATTQASDSPSSRPLYLKLEREQFYALFGDYPTGLTVTELSRYNRNLNGLKSEYRSEHADVNVFASDTNQAFVKDELRGDGTSGLYHLSRKNIVRNSETVTIETRDRYRSEVIVSSQPLARWADYSIDYESGTIFFKAPVPSRDAQFNPVFIVADYESFDSSDLSWNYGGRAAIRTKEKTAEVGVTYIHEGPAGGEAELAGMDAKITVDDKTTVRAEIATTKTETGAMPPAKGSAYLAEVLHRSAKIQGKAYVREQEQGFGLGQQNGSESGTRKLGLDAVYRFTSATSARGEAFRQYNLQTGAVRDVAELQGMYHAQKYEFGAGVRFAEDDFILGEAKRSQQFFANSKYRLTDRTTVSLGRDQSLPGSDDNADYPTRTTIGMDYRVTDTATLFGAQEFTNGSTGDTSTTRVGFRALPWTGGALSSTVESQQTENGMRLFAVSGLKQAWLLSPKWSLDASVDRSATIRDSREYAFNPNVPPASGREDFTAFSVGAGYKEQTWSWTGRVEKRIAETEDKIGMFTGAAGEVRPGLGIAGSLQTFRTDAVSGLERTAADFRIGLAYRPVQGRWIVLDRLDYIIEKQKDALSAFDNWRMVNNLVANLRSSERTQLSFQYGSKYVNESIDSSEFRGYTHLPGLELRYDFTRKWDAGIRISMLQSFETHQADYGTGVSVGFTMARNMWISIGYNVTGFQDRDFSKAEFTAAGPFVKLRLKFDQASVRDAVKWVAGQ